ncbi:MAG: glycosyltransferase [Gemmataceae bacterium]|nr:glycosyltransferase [Gemmataceae bacterium]
MTTHRASLIIATYNRGTRIAPTLDSVLAQTARPEETLVVDDCSPDRTGDWVAQHYPAARVVRPERNGGTSAARNFGAKAAAGDVLVFLDHDDLLHPHAVATLLDLLAAFPEAHAAFADHVYDNKATGTRFPDHHSSQPAFHRMKAVPVLRSSPAGRVYGKPMYHALLWGNILQQPWAIRRETFLALGGFAEDVRYCEDWDLYTRLAQRFPVVVSDAVISDHVVEGENLHLAPGQEEMHERVLLRRWKDAGPLDFRAGSIVRRKLGLLYKGWADRAPDKRSAWALDVRSALCWPFDLTCTLRAVLGLVGLRPGRSSQEVRT